jgi:hypothetical protein
MRGDLIACIEDRLCWRLDAYQYLNEFERLIPSVNESYKTENSRIVCLKTAWLNHHSKLEQYIVFCNAKRPNLLGFASQSQIVTIKQLPDMISTIAVGYVQSRNDPIYGQQVIVGCMHGSVYLVVSGEQSFIEETRCEKLLQLPCRITHMILYTSSSFSSGATELLICCTQSGTIFISRNNEVGTSRRALSNNSP